MTIRRPPTSLRPAKDGLPNFSVRLISWNTETYILYSHNNAALFICLLGVLDTGGGRMRLVGKNGAAKCRWRCFKFAKSLHFRWIYPHIWHHTLA